MNKLIYLHEFDSVRTSYEEIALAHKALYTETVLRGNIVVFTFNQFADSQGLTSLLQDDKKYETIIEMFSSGFVKVSRYNNVRTAAQYILSQIKKCLDPSSGGFIFSALPIKSTDKSILELLRDALENSDPNYLLELSELNEYNDKKKTLQFLYKYTKLILKVSQSESEVTYISRNKEYSKFPVFMKNVIEQSEKIPELDNEVKDAIQSIDTRENQESRTVWLKGLKKKKCTPEREAVCEGIIHLCYNYTVENSIKGITKHYTNSTDFSFITDFKHKLSKWLKEYQTGMHKLCNDDAEKEITTLEKSVINWRSAHRILQSVKKFRRYSWLPWPILVIIGMLIRLISIPLFVVSFVFIEYVFGSLADLGWTFIHDIENRFIFSAIKIATAGIFSSALSDKLKLPSISQSFVYLYYIFYDAIVIIRERLRRRHKGLSLYEK